MRNHCLIYSSKPTFRAVVTYSLNIITAACRNHPKVRNAQGDILIKAKEIPDAAKVMEKALDYILLPLTDIFISCILHWESYELEGSESYFYS